MSAKATEEATSSPVAQDAKRKSEASDDSQKIQKSLQLKSQKAPQDQQPHTGKSHGKQGEGSEENEFDDYEQGFGDEYEEEVEEGIKVSSSDIEPVIQVFFESNLLEQPPRPTRSRYG